MTNPGGINLNISPYFDDYDEDKKFARVLYRPGRAVQARELTQGQSLQQKQIERFANFFFKQGSIVQGCEQSVDLNLDYVKLQDNFNASAVVVSTFAEQEVFGETTGIKAYVGLVTDLDGNDPKTLYINYLTAGAVSIAITDTLITGSVVIGGQVDFYDVSAGTLAVSGTLVDFDIDPVSGNQYIWVNDLTGDFSLIPTAGTPVIVHNSLENDYTTPIDNREFSKFQDGEQLFAGVYTSRTYATAETTNATQYIVNAGLATEVTYTKGSKATIGDGIMYLADHFVKNTSQTLILDKYSNVPSYKVGLVPTKTFIDSAADSTLLDNAQGTPNFQAPGSDRLKIDTLLTKVAYNEVSEETEFVSMIEVENGIIKKRREIEIEGKIEDAIAKRTFDESGDYTLSDPKINVREHLNTGTNNGRYAIGQGGDSDLLLLEIDPFTAYVGGYRNEIISKANVSVSKGLDSQEVEQVNTQINLGSFIPTNEFLGFWNFEDSVEIDLYDTSQTATTLKTFIGTSAADIVSGSTYTILNVGATDFVADFGASDSVIGTSFTANANGVAQDGLVLKGTKIGTARIKSTEYVSGNPGDAAAVYNMYIYAVNMNVGKTFQEVRSLHQNNVSIADCVADVVLDSFGDAHIEEQAYDRLVFPLPYGSIKTLRDINGQLENGFRFRREFAVSLSSGTGTVSSESSNETFVGTGVLSSLQKKNNYTIVPQSTTLTTAIGNVVTDGTTTITGTTFDTDFVAGDYVAIDSTAVITAGIYKIATVVSATEITLDTSYTGADNTYSIYKVFPAGLPIRMDGNGTGGTSRSLTVSTPSAISIDMKESISVSVNFIATMDRANAREIKKNIVRDRQVVIDTSHPNGTIGPYSLGHSDIFKVKNIWSSATGIVNVTVAAHQYIIVSTGDTDFTLVGAVDSNPGTTFTSSGGSTGTGTAFRIDDATDVVSNYALDNGQRDNSYENAKLVPNVGTSTTTHLLAVFDLFEHDTTQGIGYLSIDSYPVDDAAGNTGTTISTTDIQTFVSPKNAASYNLRNNLDFRPIKSNSANNTINPTESTTFVVPSSGGGLHFPVPNSDFQADLQYYKGRKAKLYMNYKGELGVVDGSPGYPNPTTPPSIPDTIDLAELNIPAYPSLPKNVSITPVKNRRFTMKDIGKLQERINNLEYYTALNLLEKESRDKVIVDSDGIDRFKNGILADAFTGHSVADVSLPEYKSAIDRSGKYATAYYTNDNQVKLKYNSTTSTGTTKTSGNMLMLNYTPTIFADQPYASAAINLAQELAYSWVGDLSVVPATDNWLQTTRSVTTDLVGDLTGESDNWKSMSDAWNTEVSPVIRHWVGAPSKSFKTSDENYDILRTTSTQTGKAQIEGTVIDIASSELNTAVDRVHDIAISHTMRTRDFVFEATGLKSGSKLYAFFDGIDVTANCTQITLNTGTLQDLNSLIDNDGLLVADASWTAGTVGSMRAAAGKVYGVFRIPTNTFYVGYRELKLTDDATNRDSFATTVAKYSVGSTGLSITKSETSINTRPFAVAVDEANYVQRVSRVSTTSTNYTSTSYKRFDPLAQSFYIDESTYTRGVFLTSIDLFFSAKSTDTNLGVVVEIREMQNGFPTRKIIGNEISRVENASIGVSASSATATTFTFKNPIYLLPGNEYCFTVKPDGNSNGFQIWSGILGEIDITDASVDVRIDKQPAAGLLFVTSSGLNWSVRQGQDLKFKLNIAEFSTTTNGVVYFDNTKIGADVDYSRFTTNIENLTLSDTSIDFATNLYDQNLEATGYLSIKNLERIELTKQYQINNTTTSSFKTKATLSTDNKYISPYIDLERTNVILEDFYINNSVQTAIAGTVSVSASSTSVVGVATTFTTDVVAGQYIKIGDELRQVSVITDDTNLVTVNSFGSTHTDSLAYVAVEEAPLLPHTSNSRYISRRVDLNDGFEASDLQVYVDVNRPAGTNVKVYYRIMNESDTDSFDDKFYREMTLSGTPAISQDIKNYSEEKYNIPTANLTGGSQILYGTVVTTGANATVTGTGTRFTEQLRIGDTVALGPDRITGVISNVVSNTELTLDATFTTALGGVEIFEVLNNVVGYTTPDSRSYSGFKYFAVKVVFLSSNLGYAPRIKNLRAIALA